MSLPNELLPVGLLATPTAAAEGPFTIERSLRFNSADSAYLNRTPTSAGDRRTWTWSGWVKRSKLDIETVLFIATGSVNPHTGIWITSDNRLHWEGFDASSAPFDARTSAQLRDTGAWYHIVGVFDTTQSTDSDRLKFYINGVRQTSFDPSPSWPAQNYEGYVNSTSHTHKIGDWSSSYPRFFDGYLADIHFIDGQALDPTSFGEFDANNVWQPLSEVSVDYGTNGFHLLFSDNSTAAALGTDTSGKNNTWTVNNISVAAGSGNDSLKDVPVNGTETDTGAGGEVRGNYCTLNPIDKSSLVTLSNGNLDHSTVGGHGLTVGTIMVSSGKYYAEYVATTLSAGVNGLIGVANPQAVRTSYLGGTTGGVGYGFGGNKWVDGVNTSGLTSATTGDVIGIALDKDNNQVSFYKNNTLIFTQTGLNSAQPYTFAHGHADNAGVFNFGSRPFAYTAPSGFKALCTANLPTPTIADGSTAFNAVTWSGDGTNGRNIPTGHSTDLVWIKRRNSTNNPTLTDIVRGVNVNLRSSTTGAETTDANSVPSFDADGFSVGSDGAFNGSGGTFVGWSWDAGSSTVSNTQGSRTSNVRANTSAGFSIVTYTSTSPASNPNTIGHGLGVVPSMIIMKARTNNTGANDWFVYHKDVGNTKALVLNSTATPNTYTYWNNTSPTSTVFSVGSGIDNGGIEWVAYCFAPVAGYSAFGSYTGNGSTDGPFVYTGFRPRWVMVKRTDASSENWLIDNSGSSPYNVISNWLHPNLSNAEGSGTAHMDFLSNGFKHRFSAADTNTSGGTYIYAAFAEHPFQTSRAR